ncbi:hypothetical protein LWI29_026848 [Acer saccharum]|uniref:Uncharacterized protein n=1 Tax=Acer saccharum TaxID=4024 RepID=A0AA39SXX7_ACESA|nr:hypothetical protein LWI29_026848 [Acer saccharum]
MMRDRERGTRSNPSASCRLQLLVFCFDSTPPPSVHNGAVNGGRPSLVDARVCRPPLTLAKDKLEKSMVADNESGKSIESEVRASSGMFLSKAQVDNFLFP